MLKLFDKDHVDLGPEEPFRLGGGEEWDAYLARVRSPQARAFGTSWYDKGQVAVPPCRDDFSAVDLAPFAANMVLLKCEADGVWRITYCGHRVETELQQLATGKSLEDIADPDTAAWWLANYRRLLRGQPYTEYYRTSWVERDYLCVENINLPLRSSPVLDVDMAMSYLQFYSPSEGGLSPT